MRELRREILWGVGTSAYLNPVEAPWTNLAAEMPTATYSGKARILDRAGMLLDVGKAELQVTDPKVGGWAGSVRVFRGSCLAARSLTALIELRDGARALAQVGPKTADLPADLIDVKIVGIDPIPF